MTTSAAKAVVVFGSLNMHLMGKTPRMPGAGETLRGHSTHCLPGGKSGNQAVRCARLGAPVRTLGQIGTDAPGTTRLEVLHTDGIDHRSVQDCNHHPAVAVSLHAASCRARYRDLTGPGYEKDHSPEC